MATGRGRKASGGPGGLPDALRPWGLLAAGILLVWAFIFLFAPALGEMDSTRPLLHFVEEHGIDATALFYTESPLTGDAENYLRNSLQFSPAKPGTGQTAHR